MIDTLIYRTIIFNNTYRCVFNNFNYEKLNMRVEDRVSASMIYYKNKSTFCVININNRFMFNHNLEFVRSNIKRVITNFIDKDLEINIQKYILELL